jgi:hypothetical protein
MTAPPDTLLTLIVPASLEETVADLLLDAPSIAVGFTTSLANGHGSEVKLERGNERVRGQGRRVKFEIALRADSLAELRRYLSAALPDANLFFWTVELRSCGMLA